MEAFSEGKCLTGAQLLHGNNWVEQSPRKWKTWFLAPLPCSEGILGECPNQQAIQ